MYVVLYLQTLTDYEIIFRFCETFSQQKATTFFHDLTERAKLLILHKGNAIISMEKQPSTRSCTF